MLEIIDLHKRYGRILALRGISFEVAQGEIFGLLGPNGAGKTTLLSIVSSLLQATSGHVRIVKQEINSNHGDLRRLVGIVPQELAVYGELTARENVAFFGRLYGLRGKNLSTRVDEVLAAIGLCDRAEDRVTTFSGGMKRRLNLGIALAHQPRLLLLDEPTTGVDPQSRNHIFDEIRRVNRAGTTVIYTSHYMEEVQTLCPRIGILDHGKMMACDTLTGLLGTMNGVIRFRVPEITPGLREGIRQLGCEAVSESEGKIVEIESREVQTMLVKIIALLNDLRMQLITVETQEPNLERVFLHLTGRGLRD